MAIQVVAIEVEHLLNIINTERDNSYVRGYVKARQELESIKKEPVFKEILWGVKELKEYLERKGYWQGSINTLNKVAPQLLADGDKEGHRLKFRCTYIDRLYANGFKFIRPVKKDTPSSNPEKPLVC